MNESGLKPYIVADQDLVMAFDEHQAVRLVAEVSGETEDVGEVAEVPESLLDSPVWEQDEGRFAEGGKPLRAFLEPVTEPQYMWGWE